MDDKDDQNRLAIAGIIIASDIAFWQLGDKYGGSTDNPSLAELLLSVVVVAMFISGLLAVMFVLSKAAELRYRPSNYKPTNSLIKMKKRFYDWSVSLYIPFIQLVGILIIGTYLMDPKTSRNVPEWMQIVGFTLYFAYIFGRAIYEDSKDKRLKAAKNSSGQNANAPLGVRE